MKKLLLIFVPLLLCRCSSMEKTIGLGVGIGAASGIAASQLARYNAKGHIVLGLGGAVIGGVIAAFLHRDRSEVPATAPLKSPPTGSEPPLAGAEKDVLLVPDKIEGDQFIEHHRVWTIKKPARWELYPGKDDENIDDKEGKSDGQ